MFFRVLGLTIQTDLPLQAPPASLDPDVQVRLSSDAWSAGGTEVAAYDQPNGRLLTLWARDDGHLLRLHGLLDVHVDPTVRDVQIRPIDPRLDRELIATVVVGTVASLVHELRGTPVFHASGVLTDAGLTAIAGPSGAGKSTYAAALQTAGAPAVLDDAMPVEASAAGPVAIGASTELRLREAPDELLIGRAAGSSVRPTVDDRFALRLAEATDERHPISAILFPARIGSELTVRRLSPAEASFRILGAPRISWTAPERLATRFELANDLAATLPCYEVDVPFRRLGWAAGAEALLEALDLAAGGASRHEGR